MVFIPTFCYERPRLLATPATSSTAFMSHFDPVSGAVDLLNTNDENVAAATPRLSLPSLVSQLHPSTIESLSTPQIASRRSVDPYEVCMSQLTHFIDLQREQVQLVGRLQQALLTNPCVSSVELSMRNNAENVNPTKNQQAFYAPHNDTMKLKGTTQGNHEVQETNDQCYDVVTPSGIVHRLHVLQHESAELASKRCFPALKHLLSTFESYWDWKRLHTQDEGERGVRSSATTSQVSSAAAPSPSSLLQCYNRVFRVRDELESFMRLHTEAVQALKPYLHKWMTSANSTDEFSRSNEAAGPHGAPTNSQNASCATSGCSLQQFTLYVRELLEVTQTVSHVAHLLQIALAALCRPSQRNEQRNRNTLNLEGAGHLQAHDLTFSNDATKLQDRSKTETNIIERSPKFKESSKLTYAESPRLPSGDGSRTPSSQRAATKHDSLSMLADRAPVFPNNSIARKSDDIAWMGVLSPLTPIPPQPSSQSSSAPMPVAHTVAINDDALSGVFSPPPRLATLHERSWPSEQKYREVVADLKEEIMQQDGGLSLSPSIPRALSGPSTLSSLSPTAAVSISPLTEQRPAAAAAAESIADDGQFNGRSHSRSTSSVDWCACERSQSFAVLAGSVSPSSPSGARLPAGGEVPDFVSAAVSPAPLAIHGARTTGGENHEEKKQSHQNSSGDVRSLLSELAAAQREDGTEAAEGNLTTQIFYEQQSRATKRKEHHKSERERKVTEDAAAVHVPLDELRSTSPRSPSISHSYTALVERSQNRSSRKRECSVTPGQSKEKEERESTAGSIGRAASIPTVLWPRLGASMVEKVEGSEAKRAESETQHDERETLSRRINTRTAFVHDAAIDNSHLSTSAVARAHVDTKLFYSSHVTLKSELKEQQTSYASLPEEKAATTLLSRTPSPSPVPVQPIDNTSKTHCGPESATYALRHTHSNQNNGSRDKARIEVEALEREAEAIEATLRQSNPVPSHKRKHRWLSSRKFSVQSRNSSPSSSPSTPSASSSSSSRRSHRRITRHDKRRRHSTEHRIERTVHRELEFLRTEQQHNLQKMQCDVRAALDEVLSIATTVAASSSINSRASSCHRATTTDREAEEAENGRATQGKAAGDVGDRCERKNDEVTTQEKRNVRESENPKQSPRLQGGIDAHTSSSALFSEATAAEETELEALRKALNAAEARAARLEQLSIQLKKRLWLAEFSGKSTAQGSSLTKNSNRAAACIAEGQGAKRHLSLRDAFVYGNPLTSHGEQLRHDALFEEDADAEGALAEERALLYLVDRALTEHREKRIYGNSVFSTDTSHHKPYIPETPSKASALQYQRSATTSTSTAALTGDCSDQSSSSPLRCFDDVDGVAWGQQHLHSLNPALILNPGRSPQIRQQRASIFQRLRRNFGESICVTHSEGAPLKNADFGNNNLRTNNPAAQLSPPPFMRTPSAKTTDTASSSTTSAIANSDNHSTHPYDHAANGKKSSLPSAILRTQRALSQPVFRGAPNSSYYYASISNSVTRSPFTNNPDGISGSSLRAEQVLQNARRLLQSRGDTGGKSLRTGGVDNDYTNDYGFCASQNSGISRMPNDSGRGVNLPVSRPRLDDPSRPVVSSAERSNDVVFPSALPYNAVIAASAAQLTDEHVASQGPPPHHQQDVQRSPLRDNNSPSAAKVGKLQSPSGEVQYYGYDTSPCSAVAYSTSKLPRASPYRQVKKTDATDGPSFSSSALHHSNPNRRVMEEQKERVDSATSPIETPVDRRERSGSADATRHVEWSSIPLRAQTATEFEERRRVPGSRASSMKRGGFTPQRSRREADGDFAGARNCSPPASISSSRHRGTEVGDNAEEGREDTCYRCDESSNSRKPNRERQVRWQDREASTATRSVSHTASRNPSTSSSRGSAQDELLDKLDHQELLLQRAVTQLRKQRRQLQAKHDEIAQLASTKSQANSRGGKAVSRGRGAMKAGIRSCSQLERATAQLDKLAELLDRLNAAEEALAKKERRLEQAMHVIHRQRAALVSEDFL